MMKQRSTCDARATPRDATRSPAAAWRASRAVGERRTAPLRLAAAIALGAAVFTAAVDAQSVTAEQVRASLVDAKAKQAEADRALELANAAIEKAKASIAPASSFAHLPPGAEPLAAYRDTAYVSVDAGYLIKVMRHNEGNLMVTLHNLDGTLAGRFVAGAPQATATPEATAHDLLETGFAKCPANGKPRATSLNRDGSMIAFSWSCGGDRKGRGAVNHFYMLEPDGTALRAKYFGSGPAAAQITQSEHRYVPMSEEALMAAYKAAGERYEVEQRRLEDERIAREQAAESRRRRESESQAMWGAALSGFANGMQQAGEQQRHQQAQRQALNDEIAQMTRVAQERQRLERESQRRQAQATTAAPMRQSIQAAPVQPAPTTTPYRALSGNATGSWETAGGRSSSSSAGQASTRDRADTCVSAPVTSTHRCDTLSGYKGMVSNSCSVPVEVRMCFMTSKGWNCQRNTLAPEQTWEPGWCHANTGQVFHAVRYTDSKEPLASP